MNIFKRLITNKKISKANKQFYAQHGLSRKVVVNNIEGLDFITLPKRKALRK